MRNYRSTPQVVSLANAVIKRAGGPGALIAQAQPGPEPSWLIAEDEAEEAQLVAGRIRQLIAEGPGQRDRHPDPAQCTVRGLRASAARAKIPYLVKGGDRFFDRPEVREAMVLLRGAARASEADDPQGLVATVQGILASTSWRPDAPPAGAGAQRERWENVAALVRLAEQADADAAELQGDEAGPATLSAFVADLAERAAAQHVPTVEGVTLASLHAAKGLEWDAVFLVGLVDGVLPISYATTEAAVQEERRLLYVGVTRARRQLTLSWPRRANPDGVPASPRVFSWASRLPLPHRRLLQAVASAAPVRPPKWIGLWKR